MCFSMEEMEARNKARELQKAAKKNLAGAKEVIKKAKEEVSDETKAELDTQLKQNAILERQLA